MTGERSSRAVPSGQLSGKATLNAVASILDYGARMLVGFVLNPLLVNGLGSSGYGVWQVLGRLIGYATAASGRPTQALKWTIASKHSSDDVEQKRGYVGSAIAVWLLFLPLLSAVGGGLAWFSPIWLDVPKDLSTTVRLAAALLVVDVIVRSLAAVPQSVLIGENLGYKRMGLSAVLVLVGGGLAALALHLETGLIGVAAATVVTSAMSGILFLYVTRTHVRWFGVARPTLRDVWAFGRLSGWFLAWNVTMRLINSSDVVLLGMLASVELVTVYTLNKYLPEVLSGLTAIIAIAAAPGLGGIIGAGKLPRAARLRAELMTVTWLITTVGCATVLVWNPSFVRLWVGEQYAGEQIATLLIVLMIVQFVLLRNDAHVIDLTLDLRRKVLTGILSAALSLTIAAFLVGVLDLGIVGLCTGYIAGRSIMSVCYPWFVGRFLGVGFRVQARAALRPAVTTCLLLGSALFAGDRLRADGWGELALSTGVTFLLVLPIAHFVGLSSAQRAGVGKRALAIARLARDALEARSRERDG